MLSAKRLGEALGSAAPGLADLTWTIHRGLLVWINGHSFVAISDFDDLSEVRIRSIANNGNIVHIEPRFLHLGRCGSCVTFAAALGWDFCTGLGSPFGYKGFAPVGSAKDTKVVGATKVESAPTLCA